MTGPDYTPPPPPAARVQAEALSVAFPRYTVTVVTRGGKTCFEAVTKDDATPWCLISGDAKEICRELRAAA